MSDEQTEDEKKQDEHQSIGRGEKTKPLWLEYVGAAGVAIALVAAIWNGYYTRQQLALTARSFELGHQPLLVLDRIDEVAGKDSYNFVWKNFGGGPALHVVLTSPVYAAVTRNQPRKRKWKKRQGSDHAVVGSGGELVQTTPKVHAGFDDKPQFVQGRIDYYDIFGVRHWSMFCKLIVPTESLFLPCSRGNKVDSRSAPLAPEFR